MLGRKGAQHGRDTLWAVLRMRTEYSKVQSACAESRRWSVSAACGLADGTATLAVECQMVVVVVVAATAATVGIFSP
jgi:hypothetical protein